MYLKGDVSYKVVLSTNIFSSPKSLQALARRMATLSLKQPDLIMMNPPLFEPPTKRSRIAELSEMSTSLRAINMMRRGCFPLFQPARQKWGEDVRVELWAGDVKVMWPPKGWKDLSGDLKLLQWKVAAYRLAETMRPVFYMHRSELVDRYNFLALPGTSCHHVPRAHKETAKARKVPHL